MPVSKAKPRTRKQPATARRKTSVGKRRGAGKASAPVPDLKVNVVFDNRTSRLQFEKSNVASLRERLMTDRVLLEDAARVTGIDLRTLIVNGAVIEARKQLAQQQTLQERARTPDANLRGIGGTADGRIAAAFKDLREEAERKGKPFAPTPAKLARRGMTSFTTAERWLSNHHPNFLAKGDGKDR